MTIKLQKPDVTELKPRITVFGVGGGGGNAVNNMINAGLQGVEFVVANTDAQALTMSKAERIIQMGVAVTEGLGAGSQPEVGCAAAQECIDEIKDHLNGSHMCFVTAGMGGGTGTGAAPVVAQAARDMGILTVGVVTKPFHFEGQRRMRLASSGIEELQQAVDTLIVIPNQNLFRIANDKTTFADAFGMADQVLYSGVACITDLMVKEGLINLDFADVRSVMREMGKAMMGTGEASGEGRAMAAAEAAIANPLLDETSMKGAQGLLISITGGRDMTLFEVDEAATRIREEVDEDANIILGATFDEDLEGLIRVSVVATGIERIADVGDARSQEIKSLEARLEQSRPQKTPIAAPVANMTTQPAMDMDIEKAIESAGANLEHELSIDMPIDLATKSSVEKTTSVDAPVAQNRIFSNVQPPASRANPIAPTVADAPVIPSVADLDRSFAAGMAEPMDVKMPKIEDFPPNTRAEMAEMVHGSAARHNDAGPMGLLKRISNTLGRKDDVGETINDPAIRPQTAPKHQPLSQEANLYAPRRGNLDNTGRMTPRGDSFSDGEQLDIPAFLRRQSN